MIHLCRRKKMLGYAILTAAVAVAVSLCAGTFMTEGSSGVTAFGECGGDLKWEYTESDHTLTIKGSGGMYDYDGIAIWEYFDEPAPWYKFRKDITHVLLPDGLTHIGDYSFRGLEALKTITIPDTVVSIGDYAFYRCLSLSSLSIPGSVVAIGEGAFEKCRELFMMKLPDSVMNIGEEAFSGCTSLAYVEIPSSVDRIGDDAFEGCPVEVLSNYSDLNIKPGSYGLPESVEVCNHKCGTDLTWGVSSNGHTLSVKGSGVMKDYTGAEAPWDHLSGSVERVLLSEGLTYIGINAFCGLTHLRYILIPDTVEWIGNNALSPCSDITVFNCSGIYIEPGDFGLSQTARIFNCCPETVSVTFMDGDSAVSVVTEEVGHIYSLPKDPEPKDGFVFLGWFDSEGVKITKAVIVGPGDETVLYAGWAPV